MPHTPRHVKNDSAVGGLGRLFETIAGIPGAAKGGMKRSGNPVAGFLRGVGQGLQDPHTQSANDLRSKVQSAYAPQIDFYKQEIADGNGGRAIQGIGLLTQQASQELDVPFKELAPIFGGLMEMNRLVTAGEGQQAASENRRGDAANAAAGLGFASGASPAGIGQTLNSAEQMQNAGRVLDLKERAAPVDMANTAAQTGLFNATAGLKEAERQDPDSFRSNTARGFQLRQGSATFNAREKLVKEARKAIAGATKPPTLKSVVDAGASNRGLPTKDDQFAKARAILKSFDNEAQGLGIVLDIDKTGAVVATDPVPPFPSGQAGSPGAGTLDDNPKFDPSNDFLQMFVPLANEVEANGGTIQEGEFADKTEAQLRKDPNFNPNDINEAILRLAAEFEAVGLKIIPNEPAQRPTPPPQTGPTLSVQTTPTTGHNRRPQRTVQSFLGGGGGGRPQVTPSPGFVLPGQ